MYGVDTARFILENNYVEHSTPSSYGLLVRGAALAKFSGNVIDSVSGAVSVASDGTHQTGTFVWDLSNQILTGTVGVVFSQIDHASGHLAYPNAPEGLVTA